MGNISDYEEEQDDDSGMKAVKTFLKNFLIPILITAYILWQYSYETPGLVCMVIDGDMTNCWDPWKVVAGIIFPVWLAGLSIEKSLKLASPKVQWNDGNTSYDGERIPAGDFVIIRAGGFKAGSWYWRGSSGLLITHKSALNMQGKQVTITAELDPTNFKDLPNVVRDKMISKNLVRIKPYLFGILDSQTYTKDIPVEGKLPGELTNLKPDEFKALYKQENRVSSAFEKLNTAIMDKYEKLDGQIARIGGQRSVWGSFKDRITRKSEED